MKSPEENSTNNRLLNLGVEVRYRYSFVDEKANCYLVYGGREIKRPPLGSLDEVLKEEFGIQYESCNVSSRKRLQAY